MNYIIYIHCFFPVNEHKNIFIVGVKNRQPLLVCIICVVVKHNICTIKVFTKLTLLPQKGGLNKRSYRHTKSKLILPCRNAFEFNYLFEWSCLAAFPLRNLIFKREIILKIRFN